jgi:Ni/Fe-hydrogenase subunit HybB-like protein
MSMLGAGRSLTLGGRMVPIDPRTLLRALGREALAMPRPLRLWIGFLLVVIAVAAPAALLALPPGWEVLGTTPAFEWGLLIVAYVFFAITTSGLCLAASLGTVFGIDRFRPLEKRHAILAVLCLLTAFGIIALDLHYPIRMVFGAVIHPSPTSPMWWMGACYAFYLCVLLVEVWSMFTEHPGIHRVACAVAAATAVAAPTTLGAVFAVLAARTFWNDAFTPVAMVATAFLSGTSLLAVVLATVQRLRLTGADRVERLAIPGLRTLLAIGLIVVTLLLGREIVVGLTSDRAALASATNALVAGPLAPGFWVVRVALGLAAPLVLLALPRTRTPAWTGIAAALALVGAFVDRLVFVSAGQIGPTSVAGVVVSPYTTYAPTLVEIGILLGSVAFVALGLTLAERYLDMGETDFHPLVRLPSLAALGRLPSRPRLPSLPNRPSLRLPHLPRRRPAPRDEGAGTAPGEPS